ncbi:MAG: glycosyltransferase family 2 protein [Pseudomonadota bacterium]
MHQPFTISVIVSTYNRPDALSAVLQACFAQDDRHYEIIVADDGSTASTAQCVAALRARSPVPLEHVWQEDLGFRLARVRNLGIQAARGHYLLFLDGDCVPQPDFVSQHRKLAQRGHMVSGSRILLSEQLTARVLAGQVDVNRLSLADKLRLRAGGHLNKILQLLARWPDVGRARRHFSWRRIKGCNLAIWRSDLDRINGFDESFHGWGYEDSDIVLRLFNAGVMRKDGAFATEVLHLWHPESKRDQASSNRDLVVQRIADKTVRAAQGLQA